jgi:hypothetical protein
VYQAEAARYLAADPVRLDEGLGAVTGTGRQAIADLRHLLDVLNPDHDASGGKPTVGTLDTLLEQARNAGQPVEFVEEGTRTLASTSVARMSSSGRSPHAAAIRFQWLP